MKTGMEIETDVYRLLMASSIAEELSGRVYRIKHPRDMADDCAVVNFLSGRDEQIQNGVVNLNIFIADIIVDGGETYPDTKKIGMFQRLVLDWIEKTRHSEYRLDTDASMTIIESADTNQHYINCRLNFKLLTE